MDELTFHVPTKVYLDLDLLNRAGRITADYGSRAFLVVDSVLGAEPLIRSLVSHLEQSEVESIVFDAVGPGSTSNSIEKGLELCRACRADVVVGVGGVRALSHAKCIARLAPVEAAFDDYFSGERPAAEGPAARGKAPLAYVEVPTTCRDPFMLTDECLVTDARNRRATIVRVGKWANAAIVDPALALSLSQKLTVATLLDTLLFAIESYFSRRSTFLSETLSLRAIGIITSIMDELAAHAEDRALRLRASEAGLLVALSLSMSTLGVGSAVAFAIAGQRQVPKSMAAAVMIPHVLEMGLRLQPKKVERIGNVLGEEVYGRPLKEFSVQVVDAVRQRMGLLDSPMRLKELELDLDDMAEASQIAHALPIAHFLEEPVSTEDIFALIKQAF